MPFLDVGILGNIDGTADTTPPAAAGFLDTFSGSADDPAVDSTLWDQKTRTGAETGVLTGKLVIDRVSPGVFGFFTAYVTDIYENGTSDVFSFKCNPTDNAVHLIGLMCRHASKASTKVDNQAADTPDGYEVVLHDESWGAVSYVKQWVGGVGTKIGADFTATGLQAAAESDIEITVSAGAGQVDFVVKVDGSTVATRADNTAGRIETAGYSGLAIQSDNVATNLTIDDFGINV